MKPLSRSGLIAALVWLGVVTVSYYQANGEYYGNKWREFAPLLSRILGR